MTRTLDSSPGFQDYPSSFAVPAGRPPAQRGLDHLGWRRLLALLDPEPRTAGVRYEQLRARLIAIFRHRGLAGPEDLADETIDRGTRRLADPGVTAVDPAAYLVGIANFVALEAGRDARRHAALPALITPPPDDCDDRRGCLDGCLGALPEAERSSLLEYQHGDGRDRIERRQHLAEQLGINMNSLRIRMHRMRRDLQSCLCRCMSVSRHDSGLVAL